MTVPGIWGVERFGRRRLLLIGAIGMCVCEYIVAIIGVTISVTNLAGQRVLIAFVCIYIVCFLGSLCSADAAKQSHSYPLGLLRVDVGSRRLGNHGRDFPAERACEGHVLVRRVELAMELWHWLRQYVTLVLKHPCSRPIA